jgi:drug/metabolite transporter (DMT)-like permease
MLGHVAHGTSVTRGLTPLALRVSAPKAEGERVALAAFVASSVFAGGNAVCIRFSNRELDPLWGAGLRFSLAAAVLVAVMAVLRLEIPRGRALLGAVLYGALTIGVAFALAYYALVHLHAGLGQTLLAIVPLATLLLAVIQRQERFRLAALVGALLAVAGIAVMSRAPLQEDVPLLSVLAAVGGALCFAQAAVLVRWFPPVHPVTMNAVGMTTGAALLLIASLIAGDSMALPDRGETWAALAYLVVVGSVIVFVLYLVVLRYWTASRTSYEFVLIPVVTVVLSAWLDDEPIRAGLVLGGLLVIAGVYVGALRPRTGTHAGAPELPAAARRPG